MIVRSASVDDVPQLVRLIAEFRVTLAGLRENETAADYEAASKELADYQLKDFPIYVAEVDSRMVGYLVCRVDDKTVWAESLFVLPEYRKGIAAALYAKAEHLAASLGSETVYNWIHPNNDTIVTFLKKLGFDVLNLVEVRRAKGGEHPVKRIKVGQHEFRY